MSTSKGSGGVQAIPASSRKMVQSLKEVVNLTEAEIYATLKDCNMDPNEAVSRLLSQDPFHEVKSKREKKKEGKDASESRTRGANSNASRGGKSGADRYLARGGSASYYSSDSAPTYGKSSYKKENGASSYPSSVPSAPGLSVNNRSRETSGLSEDTFAENKGSSWGTSWGTADGIPLGVQPTVSSHSAWAGTPGQLSMADIVKMGRPHHKSVNDPNGSHYQDPSTTSRNNARSPDDFGSKDEWPSIEKPAAPLGKPIPESTVDTHMYPEESSVPFDGQNQDYESEEYEETGDYDNESSALNDTGSHSISSRKFPDDDARGGLESENSMYGNVGSYVPQDHDFEHHEAEEHADSVASVTRHLEQLSVEKDDKELSSEPDAPSVIIPDHLQVQSTDCSHLSFGSFGSGMRIPHSSDAATSLPVESESVEGQAEASVPPVGHADPRESGYYGDDSTRNAPDSSLYQRTVPSSDRYDVSSATQHERLKPENAEIRYPFASSNTGYSYGNEQLLNAAFSRTNTEMQNKPPTQSYANSLPNDLLAANVHSLPNREPGHQYSPYSLTSAMATKYASASSGVPASLVEVLTQPSPHSATQQLPHSHPYSQSPHPLGPYASMIGYPFVQQQGGYYALQQALAANNSVYQQALQYKSSPVVNQHTQQAIASGYGGLSNSGPIPGNFPMNQSAAPAPSEASLSYDDVLSSQYKISLQQRENSSMWPQGPNTRTAVPSGTYFNYQGQAQQQPSEFRQTRQAPANYGGLGYPNFYHSQSGIAQDQPQNPRSMSQVQQQQQPKQSQNWQNMY